MVAGPVSKGIVSGTTAILAPISARRVVSSISSAFDRASAGWALSMLNEEVSSNIPPPTWKLASVMPKNSSICKPIKALAAITTKQLKEATKMVRLRCSREKPWV